MLALDHDGRGPHDRRAVRRRRHRASSQALDDDLTADERLRVGVVTPLTVLGVHRHARARAPGGNPPSSIAGKITARAPPSAAEPGSEEADGAQRGRRARRSTALDARSRRTSARSTTREWVDFLLYDNAGRDPQAAAAVLPRRTARPDRRPPPGNQSIDDEGSAAVAAMDRDERADVRQRHGRPPPARRCCSRTSTTTSRGGMLTLGAHRRRRSWRDPAACSSTSGGGCCRSA